MARPEDTDPPDDWAKVPGPPVWALEQAREESGEYSRTLSLRAWQIALEPEGVQKADDAWKLMQLALEERARRAKEEDRWWLARWLDDW